MAGIPDLPIPDRGSGPRSPQGFYINPSRRPPRKPPGSREGLPGSPGVPEGSPGIPTPPGPGSRRALFPPLPPGYRGAPAREVDVKEGSPDPDFPKKPVSRGPPGSGTSKGPKTRILTEIPFDLENPKSKQFQSKLPKMRVNTHISAFWGFFRQNRGFWGFPDPAGVSFTSTPRGGAPRFPAGAGGSQRRPVAPGELPSRGVGRIPISFREGARPPLGGRQEAPVG